MQTIVPRSEHDMRHTLANSGATEAAVRGPTGTRAAGLGPETRGLRGVREAPDRAQLVVRTLVSHARRVATRHRQAAENPFRTAA
jgi:hypothetical protein